MFIHPFQTRRGVCSYPYHLKQMIGLF